MLERSNSAGGLVQHLFAVRLLFPEHAQDAPACSRRNLRECKPRVARAARETLRALAMPRLTITGKDLEDRESRDALRDVVESLSFAPDGIAAAAGRGHRARDRRRSKLDVVQCALPDLESAPLGAVTPWLINAQLLGTTIYHGGERSEALESYRGEVLHVLSVLSDCRSKSSIAS